MHSELNFIVESILEVLYEVKLLNENQNKIVIGMKSWFIVLQLVHHNDEEIVKVVNRIVCDVLHIHPSSTTTTTTSSVAARRTLLSIIDHIAHTFGFVMIKYM